MNQRAVKLTVFYCSQHLNAGWLPPACDGHEGASIKAISLPCSGKVDVPYLVKALETGADGVVIVTCPKGGCRHFEGNLRAHKRAEAVESLLEEIGLNAGRIGAFECGDPGAGPVLAEIRRFLDRLRGLSALEAPGGAVREPCSTVV